MAAQFARSQASHNAAEGVVKRRASRGGLASFDAHDDTLLRKLSSPIHTLDPLGETSFDDAPGDTIHPPNPTPPPRLLTGPPWGQHILAGPIRREARGVQGARSAGRVGEAAILAKTRVHWGAKT